MSTVRISAEDAKAELAWRRFCSDPIWAAENGWHIEHPKGARRFELREPQKEALTRWASGENSITLKARQIGWSTIVGFYAAWVAMTNPESTILFLSKGERESRLLLDKVKYGLDKLPPWLAHKAPKVRQSNLEVVRWSNGSSVTSLPSRNNPARGFTGRLVVVDEWAFLENGDEAWASIEPVTDIGGQVIGLSTANGVGNTFHELWLKAKSGTSSFTPMFFSWRAVPERDDDWYEQKKRDMQTWMLHQEYPSNPEEAFIKSGAMVFDPDVLDFIRDKYIRPPRRKGRLHYVRSGEYNFRHDDNGVVQVWEEPDHVESYCIGADVAEGLEHGDYSSAHVLRVVRHGEEIQWRVVATWHGRLEPDLFAEQLFHLGSWYNNCLIGVEANNHGLSVNTELKRMRYPKIYREKRVDHRNRKRTERLGWWTSRTSKPVLVDDLRQALRQDLYLPDQGTLDELYTFVHDGKGGTQGSPHDDRVMSLGIAVQLAPFIWHQDYKEEKDDFMTAAWWLRQAELQSGVPNDEDDWVVGGYRPMA